MPSSYTQGIVAGRERTGKEYLIRYAKGLAALNHMGSKPMEAYPEFQKLDVQRYQDNIKHLEDELFEVTHLGEWGLNARWKEANLDEQYKFNKQAREDVDLRNRYDKVIKEVEAWEPTTDRLKQMKEDAIEHLKYVREYDCRPVNWRETESNLYKPIHYATPEDWQKATIESLKKQIAFNKEQLAEEIKRTHANNLFISDLISSLEGTQ
ncbi:hypothetical protein Bcp1_188 [Bacillus phage Bcp1]|uniref:Uncharacterized protein n=1 Tax=Bacillus phage Bcp1 TaxID=584892 RepID=X2JNG5_9CAUD|nr:hypothetical protein Bcp1_188 [Bacillus phage Bcp1]AHN66663.1 hypothetical protein Bcp1_188 [Bacillus phage Bcp1]